MPDILPTCDVHNIETIWIPMSDGTRLAARLWLPEGSHEKPVPAILEYIPYRRRDGSRDWDQLTHPWIAAQGYACLRLDIRGSGDSEGIIFDEYLKQEQDDAIEAIEWIAAQPWCSGKVGMMGISWGGFNSLQVAARRPPALKAIITVCSTDDRYADDIHYMGGCLLNGNLDWGATFFTYMGRAPDPDIVGERWREMWLERLEQLQPFYTTWMEHQHRDEYWSHGSVRRGVPADRRLGLISTGSGGQGPGASRSAACCQLSLYRWQSLRPAWPIGRFHLRTAPAWTMSSRDAEGCPGAQSFPATGAEARPWVLISSISGWCPMASIRKRSWTVPPMSSAASMALTTASSMLSTAAM